MSERGFASIGFSSTDESPFFTRRRLQKYTTIKIIPAIITAAPIAAPIIALLGRDLDLVAGVPENVLDVGRVIATMLVFPMGSVV
jgi:hypothetical protein